MWPSDDKRNDIYIKRNKYCKAPGAREKDTGRDSCEESQFRARFKTLKKTIATKLQERVFQKGCINADL